MKSRTNAKTLKLVELAIFAAIVLVIQLFLGGITVSGVSFSLVLIPIVVGGMILGPAAGAFLGFVFGLVTLINGIIGADPFTAFLLHNTNTKGTIITAILCLVKATAAGWLSALVYKALKNKNSLVASFCAAGLAPIVNTGLFVLGTLLISNEVSMFMSTNPALEGVSVVYFIIIGCAGLNFVVEFLVNLVLTPAIHKLVGAASKGKLA